MLLVNALVGDHGYLAAIRAQRDHDALLTQVRDLRFDNQRLKEEAQQLKRNPGAIEDAARRELGLIRPGETLVILRNATPPR